MNKRLFLFYFFFISIFINVTAQYYMPDNPSVEDITADNLMQMPTKWTYEDCIFWAIANNNDVRRSLLAILEAEENIGMAKDEWLPTIGFSTAQNFTNYPSPMDGQRNNLYGSSYGINASWTIWEGNVRKYRFESAKLMKQQQRLAGDDIIKELRLGILQAYLNILYSAEAVEIARQSLEVSSAQVERTKKLMESGRTSKVDYAQIESQKSQDEYNLVQAKSNYASAKANLKNILNLSLDYDLNIADISFNDEEVNCILPPKTSVFEYASAWLPQFKSNELNKDIFAYNVKIAKSTYYPNISLNGGVGAGYASGGPSWGTQMRQSFNENIGLNLSIPIYDGNATRRAIAIAKLNALDYDLNKKELLNQLSQTIENLYIESDNARAKFESGKSQLEATELTSQLVDRQFELGLVNPLELLTAHNNLLNARLELLQSKYMAILTNKTIIYYATEMIEMPDVK